MDRFNSREDIEYDEPAFREGEIARVNKQPIAACPYLKHNNRLCLSWHAGWADADMSVMSEGNQLQRQLEAVDMIAYDRLQRIEELEIALKDALTELHYYFDCDERCMKRFHKVSEEVWNR